MSASKRLRAPLVVMLGVIMAFATYATPASAAPYSDQPTTSVNDQTPSAGSRLRFCGSGFRSGERVRIVLDKDRRGYRAIWLGSATVRRDGSFCETIRLGANLSGTHTLTATGARSHRSATTRIRMQSRHTPSNPTDSDSDSDSTDSDSTDSDSTDSDSTDSNSNDSNSTDSNSGVPTKGTLAFTGSNAIAAGALGGLLLVGGAAMVIAAGRRRKVNA